MSRKDAEAQRYKVEFKVCSRVYMDDRARIPDLETRRRSVKKLKEVCRQFDKLNELLDRAIASAEADIRNSPSYAYRMRQQQKKQVPKD